MNAPVKMSVLFPGPHIVRTGLFDSGRVRPADLPADPNAFDIGVKTADDLQKMMEGMGQKIEITTPEEVAQQVFDDLQADRYWMLRQTEKSKQAFRDRATSILELTNPMPPNAQ